MWKDWGDAKLAADSILKSLLEFVYGGIHSPLKHYVYKIQDSTIIILLLATKND